MCKKGNEVIVILAKPRRGSNRADVDECIASIAQALNNGGIQTIASCCGHGKIPGTIVLEGYKELLIYPDHKTASKFRTIPL